MNTGTFNTDGEERCYTPYKLKSQYERVQRTYTEVAKPETSLGPIPPPVNQIQLVQSDTIQLLLTQRALLTWVWTQAAYMKMRGYPQVVNSVCIVAVTFSLPFFYLTK